MKKRRLKKWVKEFIVYSMFGLFVVVSVIAMCYRAEQIDKNMEVNCEKIN